MPVPGAPASRASNRYTEEEPMPAAIKVSGLTKYYGKTRGVEDLSFEVPQGVTFGFLGPNGAGKTTTLRCLLGMLKPTGGAASLFGERVSLDGAQLRQRVGYVAGEVHLYDRETGRWHIDYISGLRGAKPVSANRLIDRLEFDPTRKVGTLSKGNKQKLALILGLMHDPELLMLDEPTSGLDPLNQQTVFEVIGERVAAGATLLLSSHILPEVEKVCERVGIIREGHLVAEEPMTELLRKQLRHVEVTFTEPIGADFFAGIEGVTHAENRTAKQVHATVRSEAINDVVHRIAGYDVVDVEIERASLEDVFLEYYRGDESAAAGPTAAEPPDRPATREGGDA
jgi:beta-exotoxin I transport system ATP-binding protein